MIWKSIRALRLATRLEFTPALAARHRFVRVRGGWVRVLTTERVTE